MFISHLIEAIRSISPSYFIATTRLWTFAPQLALNEQAAGCAALMFPLSLRPAAALTQPHSSEKISADFISFFFPPIQENSPWVRLQVFFSKDLAQQPGRGDQTDPVQDNKVGLMGTEGFTRSLQWFIHRTELSAQRSQHGTTQTAHVFLSTYTIKTEWCQFLIHCTKLLVSFFLWFLKKISNFIFWLDRNEGNSLNNQFIIKKEKISLFNYKIGEKTNSILEVSAPHKHLIMENILQFLFSDEILGRIKR